MTGRFLLLGTALWMGLSSPLTDTPSARATTFELRPIDKATVRVFALQGVAGAWVGSGKRPGARRFVARAQTARGTGVIITADGVIMTASHLVANAPIVGVMLPGQQRAIRARVIHQDARYDLAFLTIDGGAFPHVSLPRQGAATPLRTMQPVSVSGYPVDNRERLPEATGGRISRLNNDGRVQLDMRLNSGNSGGAVVDDQGRIVGLVTLGARAGGGESGVALMEPVARIVESFAAHVRIPQQRAGFAPEWGEQITALARWVHEGPLELPMRPTDAAELRILAAESPPRVRVAIAARVWNAVQSELERHGVDHVSALPNGDARRAAAQVEAVRSVCRESASKVGRRWSFAAALSDLSPSGGHATQTAASPANRRPQVSQSGLLPVDGSLTVHTSTLLSPLFALGLFVGGHAGVLRFGASRGAQIAAVVGGSLHLATNFSDSEMLVFTGTLDLGVSGRFSGIELAAYYTPGVAMLIGQPQWRWDGFRIEAGTSGRRVNYGTAYQQIGHSLGTIRILTGYIKATF